MNTIWHVGVAVPDLDAGTGQLADVFGVTWRPAVTRSMTVKDADGREHRVDVRVTFSLGGPFAIEAWQGIPGTPLAVPRATWFHHIGYWVDDYPAERRRLAGLGYQPFLTSGSTLLLSRGPGGIGLEPCDPHRDQPYLRDLYPPTSPFAGDPVLPAPAQ